jgi:O-antigen/teichoic acid export membrane protein
VVHWKRNLISLNRIVPWARLEPPSWTEDDDVIRESLLRLTRQSIVYGAGQTLGRGLQVILVPIFTRALAPAEYGVLDLLALLVATASILVVMGMDSALARFFYHEVDSDSRRVMVTSSAVLRSLVALGVAAILAGFAPELSALFLGSPRFADHVRIVAATLPLTTFVMFHNDVLRVTFQPWKFGALNVFNTLLVTGLSILFVVGQRRGVEGALVARLLADGASVVLGFALIRKSLIPRISLPILQRMTSFGLPIIPAAVAYGVIAFSDRWILVRWADLTAVGVYAVAVKLGLAVVLLVSAFQLAWGPFAFERAREPGADRMFARVLILFVGATTTAALAVGLFAPEILRLIVPPEYAAAAAPGAVLAFAAVASGAYQVAGLGVSIALRTDVLAWAAFAAAGITIGLGILLVQALGSLGVAIATLLGYTGSTILVYVWAQRLHPIPYRGIRSLVIFVGGVLAWAGGTSAATAIAASGRPDWGLALRVATFVAYAGVAAYLCRRTPDVVAA